MFHAVGPQFIQHYNRKFGLATPWGREWEQSSMAYLQYLMVVQSYNAYHPKFARSFPVELQEHCMDRISFNVATPNLILDDQIRWPDGVDVRAGLTPVQRPSGNYNMVRLHERARIRQANSPILYLLLTILVFPLMILICPLLVKLKSISH